MFWEPSYEGRSLEHEAQRRTGVTKERKGQKAEGGSQERVSLFPERLGEGRFLGAVSLSSLT